MKNIKEHKEMSFNKKYNQFYMRSFLGNFQPMFIRTSKTQHNYEQYCPSLTLLDHLISNFRKNICWPCHPLE